MMSGSAQHTVGDAMFSRPDPQQVAPITGLGRNRCDAMTQVMACDCSSGQFDQSIKVEFARCRDLTCLSGTVSDR